MSSYTCVCVLKKASKQTRREREREKKPPNGMEMNIVRYEAYLRSDADPSVSLEWKRNEKKRTNGNNPFALVQTYAFFPAPNTG